MDLALDEHVSLIGAVRGDDRSAFNDERHFCQFSQNLVVPVSAGVLRLKPAGRQDTISAFSSTACISTLAPAVDQSCLMSSLSLWLTPSTHGVNTIDVGTTRAR